MLYQLSYSRCRATAALANQFYFKLISNAAGAYMTARATGTQMRVWSTPESDRSVGAVNCDMWQLAMLRAVFSVRDGVHVHGAQHHAATHVLAAG